jgi:hypothetical protein
VRATATDVVRSVQETDWKNELAAFGAEVAHDAEKVTSEVGHKAQALGHRAKEAVQHLPEALELAAAPDSDSGGGRGSGGGSGAGAAGLGAVGASISKLGLSIISGAKGVVDQVGCAARCGRQGQCGAGLSPPRRTRGAPGFDGSYSGGAGAGDRLRLGWVREPEPAGALATCAAGHTEQLGTKISWANASSHLGSCSLAPG